MQFKGGELVGYVVIQPKKGKKITYEDFDINIKEHGNGITETIKLGKVILTSWNVVEAIPIQERIEADGSKRYYTPLILDWDQQFTKKEFAKQVRQGNYEDYYFDALDRILEKIKNGEFTPADKG